MISLRFTSPARPVLRGGEQHVARGVKNHARDRLSMALALARKGYCQRTERESTTTRGSTIHRVRRVVFLSKMAGVVISLGINQVDSHFV